MINAKSGISCNQNVRFTSGISAISGIKGTLPNSYQAYYPFTSDFIDQVSNDYVAIFDNQPAFGGGGINTAANTNISVTTFQNDSKGVWLDSPSDDGGANPCGLGDFDASGFVNGVLFTSGTAGFLTFNGSTAGKYQGISLTNIDGAIGLGSGGSIVELGFNSESILSFNIIEGDQASVQNEFEFGNFWTFDITRSDYFTGSLAADTTVVGNIRVSAGDDISGFTAPKIWDTSGDFRLGYIGIGKTVADITSQVLLQTGNMGISTGIGITFAEIGASISALSVTSDTIVGECFIKYVGGMLSIIIDGVESTPVASAAPSIGGFCQAGASASNALAAPGTYGGLLFEVL